MKNRIIQSLVEHNNAVFWQTKDQTVAIENTPSKNVIASNLEETVSAHTSLAQTLNVKEDIKENASDIPKNNTPENVNDFSIDHIDAVDRNTVTESEVSNKSNNPDNTDSEEWKSGTSLIVGDSMIAGLKGFCYYLVSLLKKKQDNIILHFRANEAPNKNEDEIYKNLKSIKDFINKRHPSCKVYVSAPILRLDNKNSNSILKQYVDKWKVVEEKSVIL